MEKANITLAFDQEKLDALEFYLKKEKTTPQRRLEEALAQLYEHSVPEPVREYLDRQTAPPPRPKRSPKADPQKGTAHPTPQLKEELAPGGTE